MRLYRHLPIRDIHRSPFKALAPDKFKKKLSISPSHNLSSERNLEFKLKNSKYTYRASSCTKKQSALNSKYAYSSSLFTFFNNSLAQSFPILTSQNAYSSLPFSPVVQTLLTVPHHSTIHFLSSFFATIISS